MSQMVVKNGDEPNGRIRKKSPTKQTKDPLYNWSLTAHFIVFFCEFLCGNPARDYFRVRNGCYLEDHPMTSKWLITMVMRKSPKDRVGLVIKWPSNGM